VEAEEGLSDDEISMVIRNASGLHHALFVPEIPFELLVKRQISHLKQPGSVTSDYATCLAFTA
jgi:hypothetical protein